MSIGTLFYLFGSLIFFVNSEVVETGTLKLVFMVIATIIFLLYAEFEKTKFIFTTKVAEKLLYYTLLSVTLTAYIIGFKRAFKFFISPIF